MPLVLTEVLSHLELTGAVQVDQVLVVSTSPTSLLLSRESGPLLPNGGSETSSEGLLARAEPALRDYSSSQRLAQTREMRNIASDWELILYRLSIVEDAIENYNTYSKDFQLSA